MSQTEIDQLRRRLEDERDELVRQLTDLGVDPQTGEPRVEFEHGFADSGQMTAEKANLLSVAESLLETLAEVRAALDRMDAGTYGKCEACGREIPVERLEARPHARLCVTCKQRAS